MSIAVAVAMLTVATECALSQSAPAPQPSLGVQEQGPPSTQPPQQATPAPQDTAPAPHENPGLFNEMGKLFDKAGIKSPSETLDDLNARAKGAAKDASDAFSRLTKTGAMASGRVICPFSANGTPDCKAAADKLCQGKGYKEGKSLNVDAVEACSAKVLIPGRARKPGDCRTDNYVTSALCQ